jgi:type II secretory pathway pseudopilin PulG
MLYYVAINGQAQGPYPEEEIHSMLRSGHLTPDTQAAAEGSDQWQALSSLVAMASTTPPAIAPSAAVPAGHAPQQPYQKPKSNTGLIVGIIVGVLVLVVGVIAILAMLATPQIMRAQQRAKMAQALNNMKQAKLAMDMFAMDNDGVYPNLETHEFYLDGQPQPTTSNEFFRQLIASGNITSQEIFWVNGADVCNADPPANLPPSIIENDPSLILQKGECGLAYVLDQENTDNPSRPLLMTAFMAGTDRFDPDLYDNKVNILRIDGSAKPERLNPGGRVLDGNRDDLLRDSEVWNGTPVMIAQPAQ